jgi:hypothetical protein
MLTKPNPPIHQAPVMFGTRQRLPHPGLPIRPIAPCRTLVNLQPRRSGSPPW